MTAVKTTELARLLGISRQRLNELGRTLDGQRKSRARVAPRSSPTLVDQEIRGNAHQAFNRARAVKEIAIAKEKELNLTARPPPTSSVPTTTASFSSCCTSARRRTSSGPLNGRIRRMPGNTTRP